MRELIVAAMMLVAGGAAAENFGVDFETANKGLTQKIRPPLVLQDCAKDTCFYRSAEHDITVSLAIGAGKVVERFGIEFKPNNWAIAAAYGRSIQRELMVADRDMAGLDDIAKRSGAGTAGDENTASVACTAKQLASQPFLTCSRR